MDGTGDSHTKSSESEREIQIPYDSTYTWNLKQGTNEPISKRETDRHGEQTYGCQGGGEGREGLGFGWMRGMGGRRDEGWGPTVQHRDL